MCFILPSSPFLGVSFWYREQASSNVQPIQPLRYSHKTGGHTFAHAAATSLFFFFLIQSWMLIMILLWLFFSCFSPCLYPKKRSCTDFCDNFCLFCLLSISPALATSTLWRQVSPPNFDSISLLTLHFLRSLFLIISFLQFWLFKSPSPGFPSSLCL